MPSEANPIRLGSASSSPEALLKGRRKEGKQRETALQLEEIQFPQFRRRYWASRRSRSPVNPSYYLLN